MRNPKRECQGDLPERGICDERSKKSRKVHQTPETDRDATRKDRKSSVTRSGGETLDTESKEGSLETRSLQQGLDGHGARPAN